MLPRYRETGGMDHMRLDATRRKPARQPEAVATGFEGQRNPGDRAAGPDRLIPLASTNLVCRSDIQMFRIGALQHYHKALKSALAPVIGA